MNANIVIGEDKIKFAKVAGELFYLDQVYDLLDAVLEEKPLTSFNQRLKINLTQIDVLVRNGKTFSRGDQFEKFCKKVQFT